VKPLRIAAALMVPLLALSAYVQLNDPDPIQWVLMYSLAAIASARAAAGRFDLAFPAVVAAVALVWAAGLAPALVKMHITWDNLTRWHMIDTRVEEAREMIGLVIAGGWCAVLAAAGYRALKWR
jgi:hypothetical protein